MGSQINGMLAVKQGIVIIGPALRGKTSIIRTL
jgi:GTPase SAR1 family protein